MNIKPSLYLPVVGLLCALILGGCEKDVVWTGTSSLPSDGWTSATTAVFRLDPEAYRPKSNNRFAEYTSRQLGDTVKRLHGRFTAVLSLRYRADGNASEIKTVLERVSLDRPILTDTITFPLFDSRGVPSGRGRLGIYETTVRLPFPIDITEGTTINVTPVNYNHPPTGLTSLSLILSSSDEPDHNVNNPWKFDFMP